jgi:hypothetical protein
VRRSLACITLLIAMVYLSLSIASMACALDVSDRHAPGHHHGSPTHSSFCAWACQANPVSGFVSTWLPHEPLFAAIVSLLQHEAVAPFRIDQFSVSRGPPPAFHLS